MSTLGLTQHPVTAPEVTCIDPRPRTRGEWLADLWSHREVLVMLASKQFHVRYKRASFGVLWAVAVPAVQAAALAIVFSHFVRVRSGFSYPAYTVVAVLAWGYVAATLSTASVAIVEGSGMTDKLWFPRSILPLAEALANIPGILISVVLFLILLPVLGVSYGLHTLLLIPAVLLLIAFTTALTMVLSALHVYFRDVRYLVQAALLVMFYITPIAYPQRNVGRLGPWMDFNPLTGLMNLFHLAGVGHAGLWSTHVTRSVIVTLIATVILAAVAIEVHRRYDRLFVDLL